MLTISVISLPCVAFTTTLRICPTHRAEWTFIIIEYRWNYNPSTALSWLMLTTTRVALHCPIDQNLKPALCPDPSSFDCRRNTYSVCRNDSLLLPLSKALIFSQSIRVSNSDATWTIHSHRLTVFYASTNHSVMNIL